MKIEMGESLFLSWLRHVKQCQIVQLNWKPSNSWDMSNESKISDLIEIFRNFIHSKYDRELFGKKIGQGDTQILRQGEIDALGFELNGNKISTAYAIDVAFHEGGLIYGDRIETVCRVTKKLVRSALIMQGYFDINDGEIIFASPKISPSIYSELNDIIQNISSIAKDNGLNFRFRLIGNEDFRNKVIEPVISLSDEIADTSELFMRSIQLYSLFENNKIPTTRITPTAVSKTSAVSDEIKIGQLVQTAFNRLFSENRIPEDEVLRLTELGYSNKTFGLRYPAIKEIEKNTPIYQQKNDAKGYPRYWSKTFDNGKYLISNDWYERNREPFMSWLSQLEEPVNAN